MSKLSTLVNLLNITIFTKISVNKVEKIGPANEKFKLL